jgi:hypothetical protein
MRTQYNHHEIQYAFKYCDENSITPIIIDLDYDKFVESGEFLKIATEYKIAAYQMPSNLWLTTQLDGTVITGDSDPHLFLHNDKKWYVDEIEPTYKQFDYFKNHHMYGILMILPFLFKAQHLGGGHQADVLSFIFHILPGFQGEYLAFRQVKEMIYAHKWEGIRFTADFRNQRRHY